METNFVKEKEDNYINNNNYTQRFVLYPRMSIQFGEISETLDIA